MTDARLVLRVAQRTSDWESPIDIDTLIDTEFLDDNGEPDLRLSVFVVDSDEQVVQVCAEYRAWQTLGPRGQYFLIDAQGLFDVSKLIPRPEEAPFALIGRAHHEIHLVDAGDLRALVAAIVAILDERRHVVRKVDVKTYVTQRIAANDAEWVAFMEAHPTWKMS